MVAKTNPGNVHIWRNRFRRCAGKARAHNARHRCKRGARSVPARATVKRQAINAHQRQVLTRGLRVARKKRASRNVMVSYVAAATQESTATNLRGGHGTSVGHLQLIDIHEPSGTNGVSWRMNIENSARWYLRQAVQIDRRRSVRPGRLAQKVQRSAHPHAYNQWESEARRTVRLFLGPCGV